MRRMKLLTSIDHFVKQCFSDDCVIPGKAAETAYDCVFLKLSQTAYRILKCLWGEMHCCSVTVFLTSPFYSWLLRFAAPSAPEFFGGLWPLQWRYSGTLLPEIQARGRQGRECILEGSCNHVDQRLRTMAERCVINFVILTFSFVEQAFLEADWLFYPK